MNTIAVLWSTQFVHVKHNSSHFLIQYSYNYSRFEVSSASTNSSHGDTTKNTPELLGVAFAMKYITLNVKAVYSSLA